MKDKVTSFYKDAAAVVDSGLRKYMLAVFSHMFVGLIITAGISYLVSTSQTLMISIFSTGFHWVLLLAPLAVVIYLSARIQNMSADSAKIWFYAFSALEGVSLAPICLIYTGESIAAAFFVTSSMFLSMIIYGYSTDKDLTEVKSFLTMGLFGIIIASLVNAFIGSSKASFFISLISVIVFTGLTAWDAQVIKSYYFEGEEQEISNKKSIIGALRLYLDFINLFLNILRLMGNRRS